MYMAPIAAVCLIPAALIMEKGVVGITIALSKDDINIVWYLLFNSGLAYFVNLTNFLVTKHTSALTLQVLGNAKGAVAVVVSFMIFRNPVSMIGMLGYCLTIWGCSLRQSQGAKQVRTLVEYTSVALVVSALWYKFEEHRLESMLQQPGNLIGSVFVTPPLMKVDGDFFFNLLRSAGLPSIGATIQATDNTLFMQVLISKYGV